MSDLEELRQKMVEAQHAYWDEYDKELVHMFDGAKLSATVQANAEMRIPMVGLQFVKPPLHSFEYRISAYEILQNAKAAAESVFKGGRRPRDIPQSFLDSLEEAAVEAVFKDLELRLKKWPSKKWLLQLRSKLDALLVKGVQGS